MLLRYRLQVLKNTVDTRLRIDMSVTFHGPDLGCGPHYALFSDYPL